MSNEKGRKICCGECGSFDLEAIPRTAIASDLWCGTWIVCMNCFASQSIPTAPEFGTIKVTEKGRNIGRNQCLST